MGCGAGSEYDAEAWMKEDERLKDFVKDSDAAAYSRQHKAQNTPRKTAR